jgi:ABC-type amino acid transport substrate-binding protein
LPESHSNLYSRH